MTPKSIGEAKSLRRLLNDITEDALTAKKAGLEYEAKIEVSGTFVWDGDYTLGTKITVPIPIAGLSVKPGVSAKHTTEKASDGRLSVSVKITTEPSY